MLLQPTHYMLEHPMYQEKEEKEEENERESGGSISKYYQILEFYNSS